MLKTILRSCARVAIFIAVVSSIFAGVFSLSRYATKKRLPEISLREMKPHYFDMNRDHKDLKLSWLHEPIAKDKLYCFPGQRFRHQVKVESYSEYFVASTLEPRNIGQGVNVAYRFYGHNDSEPADESGRFFLPRVFYPVTLPGAERYQIVPVDIQCPKTAGQFKLVLDLVQENVAWMHLVSDKANWIELDAIVGAPADLAVAADPVDWARRLVLGAYGLNRPSQTAIIKAYKMARHLLRSTSWLYWHKEKYGYVVNNAGSQYPMVWTRDMATIQRAWRYLELKKPRPYHWSQLFLNKRSSTGVPDWLALEPKKGQPQTGLNSILSDQDLWTVIGALEAVEDGLVPKGWLQQKVDSWPELTGDAMSPALSNIGALYSTLGLLLAHRWSGHFECLATGHVADWGDVGLRGANTETSTKLNGPRVCSLFSQALLYKALSMIEQYDYPADEPLIHLQVAELGGVQALKKKIKGFIKARLWQEKRGFYRVHFHIDPITGHPFDEGAMFGLGGHVVALEADLLSNQTKERIFNTILERQKSYKMSTISGVLLPPYPAETFENPIMDESWEYQNGGQWDWFGARAGLEMFRWKPKVGIEKLAEIARKVVKNGSFYEWEKPDGSPGAGIHYRASAAAFLYALEAGPFQDLGSVARRP